MCSARFGAVILVFISAWLGAGEGARILGLFSTPSKSHLIIHMAVVRALAEQGHDITVVTTLPLKESNPRVRQITLKSEFFSRDLVKNFAQQGGSFQFITAPFAFASRLLEANDKVLKEPELLTLMKEESFDLVLFGYFFNDFLMGVAGHFQCPIVIIWTGQPFPAIDNLVGNPPEISYVPNNFLEETQPLNFVGRIKNFLVSSLNYALFTFLNSVMNSYYVSNFPTSKYPSFDEVKNNISLVLVNHHFTQGPIRPNVPALIEIGGIQVKDKANPLPQDIKNALDNASKTGAIYFCLGSNVQSSDLKSDTIAIIFKVLSGLKQKVLWKWESEELPGNATNIFFKDWFPQDDILAHPNLKLFITHGGKGGITEAEYHGVPMLALPVMADQMTNSKQMKTAGFGLTLELQSITEEGLKKSIQEVLNNPKYRENVKKFSSLYKDRPQTAKETAVFWVEYVLRHRGASHMQSPYVHMNLLARSGMDVIGFLCIIAYIIIKVTIVVIKFIFAKLCKRNVKQKKKKE